MESGVASVEPEPAPVEIRAAPVECEPITPITESGAAPVDMDLSAAEAPGASLALVALVWLQTWFAGLRTFWTLLWSRNVP